MLMKISHYKTKQPVACGSNVTSHSMQMSIPMSLLGILLFILFSPGESVLNPQPWDHEFDFSTTAPLPLGQYLPNFIIGNLPQCKS